MISKSPLPPIWQLVCLAMLIAFASCDREESRRIDSTRLGVTSNLFPNSTGWRRDVRGAAIAQLEATDSEALQRPNLVAGVVYSEGDSQRLFIAWIESRPSIDEVLLRPNQAEAWDRVKIPSGYLQPLEQVLYVATLTIDGESVLGAGQIALGKDGTVRSNIIAITVAPPDEAENVTRYVPVSSP